VPGLGPVVASSVYEFLQDPVNRSQIDDLLSVGVSPAPVLVDTTARANLPLAGKTIVITGTLPKRSRPEAEALISRHAGRAPGSVAKSPSSRLAASDAGSKLEKAKQLNITIIDEAELEKMTGEE